jgi:hypothetical protein
MFMIVRICILLLSLLSFGLAQQDLVLVTFSGVTNKSFFKPVINSVGELVGVNEIRVAGISADMWPASVSATGQRLIYAPDGLVYPAFYEHELNQRNPSMFSGIEVYEALDNGQVFLACVYRPDMSVKRICSPEGYGFRVLGESLGYNATMYLIEDSDGSTFYVERVN